MINYSGMHAWFAAAADTRYSVAAPIIGVQVAVSICSDDCLCKTKSSVSVFVKYF